MYRIIMAENQQQSIDVVKRVVESSRKKIELIQVVNSGVELIALVQSLNPEIVLINIDLMGINGLEATKRIRSFDKDVHIIIFSEYDYFDFAKEAIGCKVDDYILKPLHYETLSVSVDKIIATIDEEKDSQNKADKFIAKFGEISEYLDYSFIYGLLFIGQNSTQLKRYKELLGFTDYGYIIIAEFNSGNEDFNIEETHIYNQLKEVISSDFAGAVGPKVLNRYIIYISTELNDLDEANQATIALKLGTAIYNKLYDLLQIDITIGIGSVKTLDEIHVSYEEASRSIKFRGIPKVVHVKETKKKCTEQTSYRELENKILENLRLGKEETIDYFFKLMEFLRPLKDEVKMNKVVELIILLTHEARSEGTGDEFVNYIHYIDEIKLLSWIKVEAWAYQKLEMTIKLIRASRNGIRSNAIREAINYMEEHYQEEISLDDISQFIGISPQHLSKSFKEETGINYVEWLTNLRIDMAKQLLTEGGQTIKEICYLVGYHDPNYFSRIFKKIVGISPSDYVSIDDKTSNNNN